MEEDYDISAGEYGLKLDRGSRRKRLNQGKKLSELPKQESIHHRPIDFDHDVDLKYPFNRKLSAGVGRPWSDVYSEIIAELKSQFHDAAHHFSWFPTSYVTIHVKEPIPGVFCDMEGNSLSGYRHRDGFFVNPNNGQLQLAKKSWDKQLKKIMVPIRDTNRAWSWSSDEVSYHDNRCFRKINNIWYEVILENLPSRPAYKPGDEWQRKTEEDWLYKLNCVDAVMKTRLTSAMIYSLAQCHGYKMYDNRLVTKFQYQKEMEKDKGSFFSYPPVERSVYAKLIVQASKRDIEKYDLNKHAPKTPDIVRRHKKHKRG